MKKEAIKIEKVINKWFVELGSNLKNIKGDPEIVSYIRSGFMVFNRYNSASLFLIGNGYKLPASALLRIQSELCIKMLWCFHGTTNYQEVKGNFNRWAKSSANKSIKLCKDFLESNKITNKSKEWFRDQIERLEKELKDIPEITKEMPHITGKGKLFDQVSDVFDDNVVAPMYSQFSSAVHIDTSVLSQSIERKGDLLIYKGDLDYKLEDLIYHCLSLAWMFVKIWYTFYKLDCSQIDKEYFSLVPKAGGN